MAHNTNYNAVGAGAKPRLGGKAENAARPGAGEKITGGGGEGTKARPGGNQVVKTR